MFNPAYGRRYLLRNHQKLAIADDQIAIIGGANIDDSYLTDRGAEHWRDLWLRITGPKVAIGQADISIRCSAGRAQGLAAAHAAADGRRI